MSHTLCEVILNFVLYGWIKAHLDPIARETLLSCLLVCKEWRRSLRKTSGWYIELSYEELEYFAGILRRNMWLLPNIKNLVIVQASAARSISTIAISHHLPNLQFLDIEGLDLTNEHRWLHSAPIFHSVKTLRLRHLQTCHVSHLIRFLGFFPSIFELDIGLHSGTIEHSDKVSFRQSHSTDELLASLLVDVRFGVLKLMNWWYREKVIFNLCVRYEQTFKTSSGGVVKLFDYFVAHGNSLELYLDGVRVFDGIYFTLFSTLSD